MFYGTSICIVLHSIHACMQAVLDRKKQFEIEETACRGRGRGRGKAQRVNKKPAARGGRGRGRGRGVEEKTEPCFRRTGKQAPDVLRKRKMEAEASEEDVDAVDNSDGVDEEPLEKDSDEAEKSAGDSVEAAEVPSGKSGKGKGGKGKGGKGKGKRKAVEPVEKGDDEAANRAADENKGKCGKGKGKGKKKAVQEELCEEKQADEGKSKGQGKKKQAAKPPMSASAKAKAQAKAKAKAKLSSANKKQSSEKPKASTKLESEEKVKAFARRWRPEGSQAAAEWTAIRDAYDSRICRHIQFDGPAQYAFWARVKPLFAGKNLSPQELMEVAISQVEPFLREFVEQ